MYKKSVLSSRHVFVTSALAALLCSTAPVTQAYAYGGVTGVQQSSKVNGLVVDQSGEAVIGATIKVVGTQKGAISDFEGNFAIDAQRGDQLEVSYIGYKTQVIKVTGPNVKVTLLEDSKALQEVVVVGFGTQKKVNLTGAVSVVDGDELAQRPVANAAQALQGVVPGLQIAATSGQLDATPSINVRGTATIGEGSSGSPLILIDGMEGDLNTINPQDIQSISVLKDAAASSIYGSRAPFGVILITTKSGSKDSKVKVNYNNSFRFSNLIRGKHMMNSVDYASWLNDAKTNQGQSVFFDAERMAAIKEYHDATPVGPGTRRTADGKLVYAIGSQNGTTWDDGYGYGIDDIDWYDVVYRNSAFSQEHNASVNGGSDKLNFYASIGYLDQGGFMNMGSDGYKRYNGTAKLNVELAKWIRMNYNMRFARTNYHRPAALTGSLYNDMARQGWPMLPLYDRNGYLYSSPSPALALATGGTDRLERDVLNHQLGFVLEPVKNWITHIDFNYKIDNAIRHWDSQRTYNHNVAGEAIIYNQNSNVHEDESKDNYLNFQAYSEYTWTMAEKHNFHVMGGFQTEQLKRTQFGLQRNGILDPSKPEVDLTNGLSYSGEAIVPDVNGSRNQWQTAGFFGRVNYNYDEKYLFEANLRYDGTSRFRSDKMWKLFPSVSLGWNIAREKFWENLAGTVNTLKLRASYGSLGNQNINNWYQTYQTIAYNSVAGTWLQNGAKPNTTSAPGLVSALLTWEKVESYDLGLDFGAFNNRLTGTFDYYIRNTKNMVGNAPELPAILGTGVPVTNNTDLRTSGWELQISWRDVLQNGLSYGVTFNISDARTKITRYPNNPTNSINNYIKGRYMNEIWGFETIGIAKSDEEMNAHLATADQSSLGSNWAAGDIMYRDLNGDNKISRGAQTLDDHGDLKVIGNSTPRYLVGLNLNAAWKGFDLSAFFQGVMKRDWWIGGSWGGGLEYLFGTTNSWEWWSVGITDVQDYYRDANTWSVQNGYQKANQDGWLPRVQFSDKNEQAQTRYLMNGAYVRLKNLQLGYTLPRQITQPWGITNLRVFVSAENLFTITKMPHQFDPELMSNSVDQNNGYPLQKTFAFGLNVSF
ncbi:TonB-dependent receptor [Prevotella sp. MA2016]|uniref:SusC/RagA family TonB-linked outer membrane protein n=1 Tax=Prevotella sp. MA2016 TaxID=1408310 RepID=UPI00048BD136|nr:TonB-dependent receptor [Prevotella sp. MA2016]